MKEQTIIPENPIPAVFSVANHEENAVSDTNFSIGSSDSALPNIMNDAIAFSAATPGDKVLPYTVPHAEYMYGCVATSIGMLLGYYDLYGYTVGNTMYLMDGLIEGSISVDSRGSDGGSIYDMNDPSTLAQFIASSEYIDRFYNKTPAYERPYTYIGGDPASGLNVSVWNCLADYLGTGQYWRGNNDLSTTSYNLSLSGLETTSQTAIIDGVTIPIKYIDYKYGLSLYLTEHGYALDKNNTKTYNFEDFSFNDYKAEIDAGRPVLLSMVSLDGGHLVLGYGYNASTNEVIFDDTYQSDCRMNWNGTYYYSNKNFSLNRITTVIFDPGELPSFTITRNALISGYHNVGSGLLYISPSIVSGGTADVRSSGIVISAAVSKGGVMNVYSGGSVQNTVASSGGTMMISQGTADDTEIRSGGKMMISGGTANHAVLSSGGSLFAYAGGSINSAVLSGGTLSLSSGASADHIRESGGSLIVSSGATATNITANSGTTLYLVAASKSYIKGTHNGSSFLINETAVSVPRIGNGMTLRLQTDVAASNIFISSGGTLQAVRGFAGNVSVGSGGTMRIENFGSASQADISNGGKIHAADYGTVSKITIRSGGEMHVSGNGNAQEITISSGGKLYISKNGSADHIALNSGGTLHVSSGGTAVLPFNPWQGQVVSETGAVVFGQERNASVYLGNSSAIVSSANTMSGVSVTSGLHAVIYSGGTMCNTTISSGGDLCLSSGGIHRGTLYIENGGYVQVKTGGTIDFTVSEHSANGTAMINDLSRISAFNAYTITVKTNQETGTYVLAKGAGTFSQNITIKDSSSEYGSLTVNGASLKYNGRQYSLVRKNASLSLKVSVSSSSSDPGKTEPETTEPETTEPETTEPEKTGPGKTEPETTEPEKTGPGKTEPETTGPGKTDFKQETPENLTATVSKYNVLLLWNSVSPNAGPFLYEVSADGETYFTSINKYAFKNMAAGTHSFAVRTTYYNGTVSDWSDVLKTKVADVTPPKTGALTIAQTGFDSVRLDWVPASDNVGIDHYVVTCGTESKTVSSSILSAEFSGVAGKVNATLTAYDAEGNTGKTVKKSIKIKDIVAPTQVTGLNSEGANNKSGGILSWTPASDNVGVTQYLIAIEGQKTYKSKKNSVKIKKMPAGTYKFTVTALDKAKNQSIVSKECSFKVADVILPKVKKLSAKVMDASAFVTWNAIDETGIAKLELSLDGQKAINVTNLGSYDFAELSVGIHSLRLTAYDTSENSAFKEISMTVKEPKNTAVLASV